MPSIGTIALIPNSQMGIGNYPASRTKMATKPASSSSRVILAQKRASGGNVSKLTPGRGTLRRKKKVATTSAKRNIRSIGTKIKSGVKTLGSKVKTGIKTVEDGAKDLLDSGKTRVENRIGKVNKGLKQGMSVVSGGINKLGNRVENTVVHTVGQSKPVKAVTTIARAATVSVPGLVTQLPGKVTQTVSRLEDFTDNLAENLSTVPVKIATEINQLAEGISTIAGGVKAGVDTIKTGKAGEVLGVVRDQVQTVGGTFVSGAQGVGRSMVSGIGDIRSQIASGGARLVDTGKRIVVNARTGLKKKLLAVLIGVSVVGFLLWDNTRSQRERLVTFVEREGGAAIQNLASNAYKAIPFAG